MKTILFLLSLVMLSLTSCYYDREEELYNCTADATTVKYTTTISSILSSYGCTGCHSGASPAGGHNFSTYAGVKAVVDNEKLWGAINHLQGFTPMPQGSGKMSACDIKKVKAWIDAGAVNN